MKGRLKNLFFLFALLVTLPAVVFLVLDRTNFLNRAFGQSADLVIDVGSSYDTGGQIWRNLSQGGEEKERMLNPVVSQLKEIKPSYIRIDHVYDFYDLVSRNSEGNIVLDWTKLDLTVNDILAAGSKPFLSLSYMPSVLSSGGTTDLPKNWDEWVFLVEKTVEHFSGNRGISDVYYEIWNEPDLLGGFKTYGDKNYLSLYAKTVEGIRKAQGVKNFKVGGPATTGYYNAWLVDLLKFTRENNYPLDFISWHQYSYSLADYEEGWLKAATTISESGYSGSLEMVISEYGFDSEKNPDYDALFGAIHTLAVTAALEGKIDKLFTFEIKDGPGDQKFSGSWGLLTHEKHGEISKKPRYDALTFLNQLEGKQVNVSGTGSWVKAFAKEKDGIIRILVVNYDPDGKHYEAVPIKLVNLPFGNFTFKRIDFANGVSQKTVNAESSTWETVEGFDPNTASVFEIIPQ